MYYAVDTTVSALQLDGCSGAVPAPRQQGCLLLLSSSALQLDGCSSAVPAPRQQGCYAVDTTVSAIQLDGCSSAVPAPRQQGCLLLLSSRGVINYLALWLKPIFSLTTANNFLSTSSPLTSSGIPWIVRRRLGRLEYSSWASSCLSRWVTVNARACVRACVCCIYYGQ